MRVILVTPFDHPSVRGNAITVRRIASGLTGRGVTLDVIDLSTHSEAEAQERLTAFAPDVVHVFHAFLAGPVARRLAAATGSPLVVTLTGTDANYDLVDPARSRLVREVLSSAVAVVAFHDSIRRGVLTTLPELGSKFFLIPQSAWLPSGQPFPLSERAPVQPGAFLFLLPAGIRPVKAPRYVLEPFEKLIPRHPHLRLLYAGPMLDPLEGEQLFAALLGRGWAHYLGEVPHEQMRSLIEQCDVVLNSSRSEGGMANSVLEAMSVARPILAADIEGNRSVIEDGVSGFLYKTDEECIEKAERLILDGPLRMRLGAAAREKVQREFSPDREIEAHLALYSRVVPSSRF
jgi:glycosyltransferase involved in cell wall biosynthesis